MSNFSDNDLIEILEHYLREGSRISGRDFSLCDIRHMGQVKGGSIRRLSLIHI